MSSWIVVLGVLIVAIGIGYAIYDTLTHDKAKTKEH